MIRLSLITALTSAVFFLNVPSQDVDASDGIKQQGIEFFEGSWEDALQQAKEEDKLIFMDAYAVWCGPCKLLKRNVFPLEEVGAVYNTQFINIQMDMEKGIGKKLAQRYKVMAYPTLLFINGDGEVVHKAVGYHPKDQFISLGEQVIQTQMKG